MRVLLNIALLTVVLVLLSTVSMADVKGSLEWDYGQYYSEVGGGEERDMASFGQKYAMFWDRSGLFMDGRAGKYDLSLGGEWISLNSDVALNGIDNSYDVSTAKLLYRGEIVFAPGGLPFRFSAYARDMSPSRFLRDNSRASFLGTDVLSGPDGAVLAPDVVDNIQDGQRFEMGASMILGIKNGSYLGRFRNILSHFPKLYVDYSESHVRDLKTRTPEHFVDRDLAFVSLNKKHNWFHYRFFEHNDMLNPGQNHLTRTYLLGTINQHYLREWINLTNWVKISVDASLFDEFYANAGQGDRIRYDLNFFATTERRSWESSVFSRFWRQEKLGELQRYAEVPVYVKGAPDRDNAWWLRFIGSAERVNRPFALVSTETDEDVLYSKLRWETNREQRNVSAPVMEVERKFGDKGQGWAVRGAFEYYSNGKHKSELTFFSSLGAAYFNGVPSSVGLLDTNLFELSGRFDVAKQVSSRFRTGVESSLLVGTGQAETPVTEYVTPLSLAGLFASTSGSNNFVVDGSVWRGRVMWFADHVSVNRYENRYELQVEHQNDGASGGGQYLARHKFRYRTGEVFASTSAMLLFGDDIRNDFNSRVFDVVLASGEFDGLSMSGMAGLDYRPDKNHRLGGKMTIEYRDSDAGKSGYLLSLRQDYRFTRYKVNGVVRRLYELSEFLDYERIDSGDGTAHDAFSLTGEASVYPERWLGVGGRLKWQHNMSHGNDMIGAGFYADLDFELFKFGFDYEYGLRTEGDAGVIPDRNEQRWKISVKKTF